MIHIEVQNLTPEDYYFVAKIRETFRAELEATLTRYLGKKINLSFSFPQDPRVTSTGVPVIIIIYVHRHAMDEAMMTKLLEEITKSFREAIIWRICKVIAGVVFFHMMTTSE